MMELVLEEFLLPDVVWGEIKWARKLSLLEITVSRPLFCKSMPSFILKKSGKVCYFARIWCFEVTYVDVNI